MASTSTTAPAYQKSSTLPTRSLGTNDPLQEPSTTSSQDVSAPSHPTLKRRNTNNYADAVAASQSSTTAPPPASDGDAASSRPAFDRQQSWHMRDLKREHAEKMLNAQVDGGNVMGYSSTQK